MHKENQQQHCNTARNILREVVFCNLSHSGTRKMCLSRIYHSNLFHFPGLFVLVTCFLVFSVWLFATTRCKSTLRHCTVFWLKWPVHDLVLVIPPPLLIKVASNTRPYSKLRGTTLNGGEEGRQYYTVSHRPVTSTDLKQERSFFRQTVSIFCNWL